MAQVGKRVKFDRVKVDDLSGVSAAEIKYRKMLVDLIDEGKKPLEVVLAVYQLREE